MKNRPTPSGFTLFELLVVFTALALLAAFVVPVLKQKSARSDQATCMNHQRQLAIGLLSFCQDNDEMFPLPSDWIESTSLTGDPKIFACPASKVEGTPESPDYGMSAYAFDLDPQTGEKIGLALGMVDDPTTFELLTDCTGPTGLSSKNPIRDEYTNPFPKSYTVNGFLGDGCNADFRHNGAIVVAYCDGHVAMVKRGLEVSGLSPYGIPIGYGRCFLDLSSPSLKPAELPQRLSSFIVPTSCLATSSSKVWGPSSC
jgi:prepilin-type processing-associated H-X9-DG protein